MQFLRLFLLTIALITLVGCDSGSRSAQKVPLAEKAAPPETQEAAKTVADTKMQPVSLKDADQSQSVAEAVERKIIKDAEITLEVPSPSESQQRVSSIAESHGGFVVNSEAKQRPSSDPTQRLQDVTLVVRVPAAQFDVALNQIRALSNVVPESKTTGQDVTEEFIDLEARIKTQKALEAQFLEIMKQARTVSDALEVQRQIADVRGTIEKIEGRKRFLENRASLSTITVHLNSPNGSVVSATGFRQSVKEAVSNSVDIGGAIIIFLIQFIIVMIPIFLLILLPIFLVVRYFVRRAQRFRLARQMATVPSPPMPSA